MELMRKLDPKTTEFVDEVTRSVKAQFDVPINEGASVITQYLISADHIQNAFRKPGRDKTLRVLDRCSLDGYIYTEWLMNQVDDEIKEIEWIKAHRHTINVFNMTRSKYDLIFYTEHADVPLEDDGERSVDIEFRADIVKSFNKKIGNFGPSQFDKVVRLKGTVEERLETIYKSLETIGVSV